MVVYVGIYSTWVCTTGTKPGEGSKEIFLFNLKISGIILCLWSLVENLESIRIAGQILFAMDSAHTVQALGAVDGGGGGGDKKKNPLQP